MPLLETKGAASAQGFGEFAKTSAANYIEDVFSTYLYTGNGSTQTITNGIDLSTKGGLVWTKERAPNARNHFIGDSARDNFRNYLYPNLTNAESGLSGAGFDISSVSSTGYSLGADNYTWNNESGSSQVSWTFRKQAKFFDVVTYTGNGTTQNIAHNLGSTPGCIIVKSTNNTFSWGVYHRSYPNGYLFLNSTNAGDTANAQNMWGNNSTVVAPTSTQFTVGSFGTVNSSGTTYVAYLFAHDAGGFGLTGTDNVISCGSFTTDGSGTATVNLGYEPQWILFKGADVALDWYLCDTMRGLSLPSMQLLIANTSAAESTDYVAYPTATGFVWPSNLGANKKIIYIAIRRGPMKTPTDATKVFTPTVYTGTNVDNRLVDTTIAPDMVWVRQRDDTVLGGMVVGDRLRAQPYLLTGTTAAEVNDADAFDAQIVSTTEYGNAFSSMNGFWCGNDATAKLNVNTTSNNHIAEAFKRAPGFFDVVCYTGTGSATTQAHNLGVVPELMIVKRRNTVRNWTVYVAPVGTNKYLKLNLDFTPETDNAVWNNTAPTSTVFSLGTAAEGNGSGDTYVAYLFASLPGVSKVGSYTGTGTTKQIDCGFTGGARFVLIKRTDSTGDWYVWDSARGIVAGNDPYLLLNSTAAEVTNTDYVDTYSAGFEISSTAPAAINANGGSYIFLAIA